MTGNNQDPEDEREDERKFLHAISTPLSSIGLLVEGLNDDPATTQEIRECLKRITQLIRDRRERINNGD